MIISKSSLTSLNKRLAEAVFVITLIAAMLFFYLPVFDNQLVAEYRDNFRYSWLYYYVDDISFTNSIKIASGYLGFVEVPSLAIFYLMANNGLEFEEFIQILFLLNIVLLLYLWWSKRLSFLSLFLILSSFYFFRVSVDLHKLQISYQFLLLAIIFNIWRPSVIFFHLSWVAVVLPEIISKFVISKGFWLGKMKKSDLTIIFLLFVTLVLMFDFLLVKFFYYFKNLRYSDFFETLIFGIPLIIAFPKIRVVISLLIVAGFGVLLGNDRLLILLFLWFLTTEETPKRIGALAIGTINVYQWYYFLGSDQNVFFQY